MKEIIAQYGMTIIAVLVAGILFFLLFHIPYQGQSGIAAIIGGWIAEQNRDQLQEKENESYRKYHSQAVFHVTYQNDCPIIAGEKTPVQQHFEAKDSDGTEEEINICAIKDAEGNLYHVITEQGKEYLYLEQPGEYQIYFQVRDSHFRVQYATLAVPVQRSRS